MATKLSNEDQTFLSKEQQEQIKALKEQYAAAQTDDEREKIHADAENIRANAAFGGYSTDASGLGYKKLAANMNGQTAADVEKWLADYKATNWDPKRGWTNGYDVDANMRSRANYIRQQMEANSAAWHNASEEDRAYLHNQNKLLADLLAQNTGHSTNGVWDDKGNLMTGASYGYDAATGKWWTRDANNGYGTFVGYNQPNVYKAMKEIYGYTDDQMRDWSNNRSSLYYNFVDAATPGRNQVDESSGFSGRYAPFANGAHLALIGQGTNEVNRAAYANLLGDGFNDEQDYAMVMGSKPQYDSDGNIIKTPTAAKPNFLSDYTKQFTAYTQNGVIMPNSLQMTNPANAKATNGAYTGALRQTGTGGLRDNGSGYVPNVNDGNHVQQQAAVSKQTGSGSSPDSVYDAYTKQLEDAALLAELEALRATYETSRSELDAEEQRVNDLYKEEKRRASGNAAQAAAGWREVANAYGLNSGAIGQAALAQGNRLQEDLMSLARAQTAALTEIQRQRATLSVQFQSAINQAIAENDPELAMTLLRQCKNAEKELNEQEAYYTNGLTRFQKLWDKIGGVLDAQ